ncbi:hypothetical protein GGX14DRAFT_575150 [Mycena pura]|uniref:Uncharacterized protein n=1 Tax=Mycena pura TaxID=153505 RepID=A0AAD6UZK5_9AGAR|nr:hypothetical protein GGX14DRAFT_575150 [Mycena pura]
MPQAQPAACTCRLAKTLVGAFLLRSVARNDIFDHEVDARRRRNRPLPGGRMYYICLSSTCWGIASTMQVMVALIVCTFGGITLRVVRPARRACTPGFQPSAERHGARYTECRTSPFRAHTVRALAGAQLSQPWLAIAVHATCTFGGVTLHSRSLRTHSTPSPADRVGAGPDTFARVWSTQPKQWPRTSRQLRKGRHHRWTSMGAEGGRLDACIACADAGSHHSRPAPRQAVLLYLTTNSPRSSVFTRTCPLAKYGYTDHAPNVADSLRIGWPKTNMRFDDLHSSAAVHHSLILEYIREDLMQRRSNFTEPNFAAQFYRHTSHMAARRSS